MQKRLRQGAPVNGHFSWFGANVHKFETAETTPHTCKNEQHPCIARVIGHEDLGKNDFAMGLQKEKTARKGWKPIFNRGGYALALSWHQNRCQYSSKRNCRTRSFDKKKTKLLHATPTQHRHGAAMKAPNQHRSSARKHQDEKTTRPKQHSS